MAQIIKLRRSSVSGQKPTNANLELGELALNTTDGKAYMPKSGSLGPSVEEFVITNTTNTGSINISGSLNVTGTTTSIGNFDIDGHVKLIPTTQPIDPLLSGSYIYASGSTDDIYFEQNTNGFNSITRLRWLEGNLYTGLLHGGIISAQSGSTTFNVSSGSGIIVNLNASLNDEPYPSVQHIKWDDITSQSLTYLTSSIQTFIGIDSNKNITQQTTPFNDGEYNTKISLGTVLHQNKTTINGSNTYPNVAYGYKQRTYDFIKAFGPLKLSGFDIITSGSLGLTVSSGTAWADGRNYQVDPNNSAYITDPGTNISKIFRYYQSGSSFVQDTNNGIGYSVIDPANYNPDGLGVLTPVPGVGSNRKWSTQRIYWFPNSATKAIVVYYGTRTYPTHVDAVANIPYEHFFEVENTKQNAIYLGALVIRNDGVFTNSNLFSILPGGIFRNIGGSGGGGSAPAARFIDLTDVNVSSPIDGQTIVYDSTNLKWINSSYISSSISGNADTATSSSYALSSSFSDEATSSSFALTASFALNASGGGQAKTFTQSTDATTWSFNHNFNTISPLIEVYDSNYSVLIPTAINNPDQYTTNIYFDVPQSGHVTISTGGDVTITGSNAQLNQTTLATTWSFQHGLNTTYPVFTIYDENNDVIIPQRINVLNANTASIYFSTPRTGVAVAANCGLSGSMMIESSSFSANSKLFEGRDVSSFATTGSNIFNGDQIITGSLFISGSITAQKLNVQQVTSSVVYSSGSNSFGNNITNTQTMTGSVNISGSLNVNGTTVLSGSLIGLTKANIGNPAGNTGVLNTGQDGIYSYRNGNPSRYVRFNSSGTYNDFLSAGAKLVINFGFSTNPEDVSFFEGSTTVRGGHVQIGTSQTDARLVVAGRTSSSDDYIFKAKNASDVDMLSVRNDGLVNISGSLNVSGTTVLSGTLNGTSATFNSVSLSPALTLIGVSNNSGKMQFSNSNVYSIEGGSDFNGLILKAGGSTNMFLDGLVTGKAFFTGGAEFNGDGNFSGACIANKFYSHNSSVAGVSTSFVNSGIVFGNLNATYLVSVSAFGTSNLLSTAVYIATVGAYSKTLTLIGGPSNHFGNGTVIAQLSSSEDVSVNLQVRVSVSNSATVEVRILRLY